jgi:hypothetical protein
MLSRVLRFMAGYPLTAKVTAIDYVQAYRLGRDSASRVTRLGKFSSNGGLLTLGSFLKIQEKGSTFFGNFFHCLDNALNLTKNGLG